MTWPPRRTHRLPTQWSLLRYAVQEWSGVTVVLGVLLLSTVLDVLRPWPTKLLVDEVLGQQSGTSDIGRWVAMLPGSGGRDGLLLWICISTVLIFLVGTLTSMVGNIAGVRVGQRMTYDLAADMFLHLQRLSLVFHSRRSVGDTISRVTGDAYCVNTLVMSALLPIIHSAVGLIAMFFIMWSLDPTMTVLSLGIVPFLVVAIKVYEAPMRHRDRETRDQEGRLMSLVEQVLNAIPIVQAFTREAIEDKRFRSYSNDTVRAYLGSTAASMWFILFVGLVTAVGTAAIMWLGARHVLDGQMTVGTILVFLAYLASLYTPLNAIVQTVATMQQSAASADRVMEILNTPLDVSDLPNARDVRLHGNVRFDNVTFGYDSDRPVLKNISFKAHLGDVVAIVGPTGAGKTTLVNLLVRFFDPWSGRVTVDGLDLREIQIASLRRQVALVLQEPFIFPFTVADNIAYGRPDATRLEIIASGQAANADNFIRRLPDGYDTVIGERGATLSGGEKQRLSIARAFLKNAPILILDEPTSALDARTEAQLLRALRRLMKDRATFIIAHRLSTIRDADRILVVDHGEIVEQGRHEELVALGGLYAALYRQQMDLAQHEPLPVGPN